MGDAVASISESAAAPTKVKAEQGKAKTEKAGKAGKRQRPYQLAVGEAVSDISASSISTEVSAKNLKNSKNKEKKAAVEDKKDIVKDPKSAKKETKRPIDEPKTGDKLPKMVDKKQSKSPRRRAEAYQRPASTSSEEGDHSHSHPKRSHKARGVAKKQAEKGGSSILKFSEAADVVNAAIKIQGAYRGYRARVEIREHHDSIDVPDDPPVEPKKKQETPPPKKKKKKKKK